MKVLVLGKNGQVATDLIEILSGDISLEIKHLSKEDVNFADINLFNNHLKNFKDCDVLINCSSYNFVDLAEQDKESAFKINRDAVRKMAQHCQKNNSLFIHFSTNYVFDGKNPNPNTENDNKYINPLGVYGASKLAGEQEVQKSGCQFLILRLATVFREGKSNFVTKMIELFQEKEELQVVADQISNPTYSYDVATAIHKILQQLQSNNLSPNIFNKIYHLSNQGVVSFYELCNFILQEASKLNLFSIKIKKVKAILSSQFKTAAQRPKNGSFDLSQYNNTFNHQMPTWQNAIQRMIKKHQE